MGRSRLAALEAEIRVQSQIGGTLGTHGGGLQRAGRSSIDSQGRWPRKFDSEEVREEKGAVFSAWPGEGLALPILNGAVVLLRNPSLNRLDKAGIALGPAAERPFRPRKAEALLESGALSSELVVEAARMASEEASPRSSLLRGGDVYRREMIQV